MSAKAPYKVLFLCTGNSACSVMVEYFEWTGRNAGEKFTLPATPATPTK